MTSPRQIEPREATPRSELWLYFWAAVSYIAMGFPVKQVFAWWWFGAMWMVGFVWVVPMLIERRRAKTALRSAAEPGEEP